MLNFGLCRSSMSYNPQPQKQKESLANKVLSPSDRGFNPQLEFPSATSTLPYACSE
jgi:hypothetical protein